MSTSVIGLVSNDNELYKKHAKVLQACIDAEIEFLPKETAGYFNSKCPCKSLFEEKLEVNIEYEEYCDDMDEGLEIIVSEIPEGVHKIRFLYSH